MRETRETRIRSHCPTVPLSHCHVSLLPRIAHSPSLSPGPQLPLIGLPATKGQSDVMLGCYNASGAQYRPHVDESRGGHGGGGAVLSLVYYINAGAEWDTERYVYGRFYPSNPVAILKVD